MAAAHAHQHAHPSAIDLRRAGNRRRMRTALGINAGLLAVGVAGGILFDSLAVFADAGHVLSDLGAIALGLAAAVLAGRGGGSQRTFGFHRGEVLAALLNGLALVAIATVIVVAAIGRLQDPPEIEASGVLAVGLIGLAGNAWATAVLGRGERADINLEAVLRHSAADALGSLAVVAAAVAVLVAGWERADPIASIAIAILILASSVRLVREPFDVLMESAPARVDVDELAAAMGTVEGVSEVHELHIWTVTSGFEALAAHVVTAKGTDRDRARRELEFLLRSRFGIEHTTLQMEESADPGELLQVQLQGK
jgi:cobalt-zinc-cadmium efflux system protein